MLKRVVIALVFALSWRVLGVKSLVVVVVGVAACWLLQQVIRAVRSMKTDALDMPQRRLQALCLAYPNVNAPNDYFELAPVVDVPALERATRHALLHALDLHADMSLEDIRSRARTRLQRAWYRLALDRATAGAEPRDALAFACARVSHVVRLAGLLGWIDDETQWQVLMANVGRAADCFDSWHDFGVALARGRRQWVACGLADSLGLGFDEVRIAEWMADRNHPWSHVPWPLRGT